MPQKKKTSRAKPAAKKDTPDVKMPTAYRQLWAIVLFAAAALILFIVILDGPNIWGWLHSFFLGTFGVCAYVLPVILGYIAVMNTLDKPVGKVWHKVIESAVLVTLIGAAIDIFSAAGTVKFGVHLTSAYTAGTQRSGGGFLGALIGHPLVAGLGSVGAKIFIIILIFVAFMIVTGTTLISLFRILTRPVASTARGAQERMERRVREQEEREERRRYEIDIPVSGIDPEDFDEDDISNKKKRLLSTYRDGELPEEDLLDVDLPVGTPPQTEAPVSDVQKPEPEKSEKTDKPGKPAAAFAIKPSENSDYLFPPYTLLDEAKLNLSARAGEDLQENALRLVETLRSFGVETRVVQISRGPSVTRYELQPSAGVKISKITNLSDDIALNLATAGVRIEAPIPNKRAVGIEVPNKTTSIVYIREVLESGTFSASKSKVTMALGKDIAGNHQIADIAKMPHMLIAGATGSGKSVCINSLIISILYKASPGDVKLLMIDPKVVELGVYNGIPHLITPVVTDPRKAAGALGWAVTEMLRRYKLFADNAVRDIMTYNKLAAKSDTLEKMPQIVIVIDELADLMMAAPHEVEDSICRLAQMARAAGMHLVIATQRPSVDVITGIIKANIPSRIAFMVSSQVDSRTILDMGGAEKLMGKGDMLFYPVGAIKPARLQGCWVSEREVEAVVNYIKSGEEQDYDDEVIEKIEELAVQGKGSKNSGGGEDDEDPMIGDAIEVVVEAGLASTSLLQRRLKLGYSRAARIMDQLETKGIIGPFEGSKPRQVLITRQQMLEKNNR